MHRAWLDAHSRPRLQPAPFEARLEKANAGVPVGTSHAPRASARTQRARAPHVDRSARARLRPHTQDTSPQIGRYSAAAQKNPVGAAPVGGEGGERMHPLVALVYCTA